MTKVIIPGKLVRYNRMIRKVSGGSSAFKITSQSVFSRGHGAMHRLFFAVIFRHYQADSKTDPRTESHSRSDQRQASL